MTTRIDVAVVIPVLNGGRELVELLRAIAAQEGRFRPSVVAIDSGSTDGSLEALRACGASVLTVAPADFNHGDTRNLALGSVQTEFAVLIVQDALPSSPRWLEALVSPLVDDPCIAGTWARQMPREDASRITAHSLSHWIGADSAPRTVGPLSPQQFAALNPAERHLACAFDNVCSCIRMSVWRANTFPRARFAEDIEWGMNVLRAGHRLAFVPEAVVRHSHERSVSYELQRTYVAHQRLRTLFGLATVPTAGHLVRAVCSTLPVHIRLAAGERSRRTRALARAVGLAVAWPLGQYLGAKSARDGRELLKVRGV
jgi:rhamnosyltransferase